MFYDYELLLWEGPDLDYNLTKNKWNLEFERMPRGLGRSYLKCKITDNRYNDLSINIDADSRNALFLGKKIANIIQTFHEMSAGKNLQYIFYNI